MVKKLSIFILTIFILLSSIYIYSLGKQKVSLIGHRGGLQIIYPENSLIGFIEATKYTKFLEMDISFTKDHHPILLHDRTLNRTTNCNGEVSKKTYNEIKKCKLKDVTLHTTTHKISHFKEIIHDKLLNNSTLIVEIKEYDKVGIDNFMKLVKERDIYLQSFSLDILTYIHDKYNYPHLFLISGKIPLHYPKWLSGFIVNKKSINSNILKQINPKYKIYIWTINDDIEYQKFNELKIDGIMTDDVRYFSKYSKEWYE